MAEHPTPPPLPREHAHAYKKRKPSGLFSSSVAIFAAAASALYLLVEIAGVNVVLYYPTLRMFSFQVEPELYSMTYFGRVGYAIAGALVITALHIFLRPLMRRIQLIKLSALVAFMAVATWFTAAIITVQTWHELGIARRALDTTAPINDELYLAIIGTIILFGGVLLTSFAVRRVKSLTKSAGMTKPPLVNNGKIQPKPKM